MQEFPAHLGPRERLLTWGVGYGVGLGVPLVLGISFAIGFGDPRVLLFPLPFMLAFGIPYFFRPRGYGVNKEGIRIQRIAGAVLIPLAEVQAALHPATRPNRPIVGIARVEGLHGTFGTFRSRDWGRFRLYVTDHRNVVELRLEDGSRVIVSPDDPAAFLQELDRTARMAGSRIEVSFP